MLPDNDAIATYGGVLKNYANVIDPTTDEDVTFRNVYVGNVAMMTRTATRAIRSFIGHATIPTDPLSGLVHQALWGNDPTVKPSIAHFATGAYDLTWPVSVTDELGDSHDLNFQRAWAVVTSGNATFVAARPEITGPNTVRVYTYLVTASDDLVGKTITVFVI